MMATRLEEAARLPGAGERVLRGDSRWRLLPFLGPAFIACVAYMDPGNFATNIAGGSKFGFTLVWVIVASNLMAMLIQTDRKSTRLNSSHANISYAVFCLKKKKKSMNT